MFTVRGKQQETRLGELSCFLMKNSWSCSWIDNLLYEGSTPSKRTDRPEPIFLQENSFLYNFTVKTDMFFFQIIDEKTTSLENRSSENSNLLSFSIDDNRNECFIAFKSFVLHKKKIKKSGCTHLLSAYKKLGSPNMRNTVFATALISPPSSI